MFSKVAFSSGFIDASVVFMHFRRKMGILLNEYKGFLKSTDGYHWYWEQAHPKASWYYWTLKGIAGKIRGQENE